LKRKTAEEDSILSPEMYHSYLASRHNEAADEFTIPPRLVATFSKEAFDSIRRRISGHYLRWYYERRLAAGALNGVPLAALYVFVGSPAATMMLEEMIASGARSVVELGYCGGVSPSVKAGDIILAKEAFADEGTSGHYFESPKRFRASTELTKRVEETLMKEGVHYKAGGIWTTDAPYRETKSKLLHFRNKGALGVNMESSALFALGEYRRVNVASLQVVSDHLGEGDWSPSWHLPEVTTSLSKAAKVAVDALVTSKVNTSRLASTGPRRGSKPSSESQAR